MSRRSLHRALHLGLLATISSQPLSEVDFAVFAKLRELLKSLAEAEGVPPYAVFTNEHLASMVRGKLRTLDALGRIEGVGPGRVDRYGARFLALLEQALVLALA
ncbi:HRDC domain-containing protein [Accumulibacter sp.]|jgi:superfamily II DNA helicase RecQ|uniref:HRDC domain-containing protein n=1 Tax=Accumulibacter sp. TaxID=2053492 RepID=UPI001ACA8BB6|nr:HRDC domain-containing protein [Accumulibacter sp.]MBN8456031.1 HRDC domain-containing protein [Accumulibacter sp.]MBO3708583.1 HRDC domain-containing protein [Candidatus Accumulibacter conexus]